MNVNFGEKAVEKGRKLLKKLLPELRKEISIADKDMSLAPTSLLGQSVISRIRLENLDALVIRKSAKGWHADVIFKGLPVGVSNVMGTPEAHPLPTEADAQAAGRDLLKQLIRVALENEHAYRDTPAKDTRVFELHDYVFQIPGSIIDNIGMIWAAVGHTVIPDAETARGNLSTLLTDLLGEDSFDKDKFTALSVDDQTRVLIGMATLMVFNEFRHPPRPAAEPYDGPEP